MFEDEGDFIKQYVESRYGLNATYCSKNNTITVFAKIDTLSLRAKLKRSYEYLKEHTTNFNEICWDIRQTPDVFKLYQLDLENKGGE